MATYEYQVTVSASKFVIDGYSQASLEFGHGVTYKFDVSDSSMSGHLFQFSATSDNSGNAEYTTGVTKSGTAGSSGAFIQIEVTSSTTTPLYYYCGTGGHSGYGGSITTTSSEFVNTSGVVLRKPVLGKSDSWGHSVNQNIGTIAGKLPQSFTLPIGTGSNNQAILSDGSGGSAWGDIALTPEITALAWYSDSGYSSALSASEAINIDDATYLKVSGNNLGSSGVFGSTAYVQIINTTQSNAVVGNNQSGLTGCVTADSHQSDEEWRFTINPNGLGTISAGDTLKVKAYTNGGESLFATGYVVSADPTSATTVNSSTISNTASVGSYGGIVAGGGDDSNTKLLLNFDRSGGTDFEDSSNIGGDGHKVTATNAVIKASPFGDGKSAIFFDGSNDYLELADHADWELGDTFTLETWLYMSSSPTNTGQQAIYAQQDSNFGTGGTRFVIWVNGTTQLISAKIGDTNQFSDVSTGMSFDKWHHLAIVFDGTNATLYIDGSQKNQTAIAQSGGVPSISAVARIGYQVSGGAFQGYMDEFRIVKGTAVYTGDFDVPTSRFSASDQANTKLLIHSNQDHDSSDYNRILTSTGAIQVTQSTARGSANASGWNSSAWKFDGTDDKITTPDSDDWSFGTGAFTIEAWLYNNDWDGGTSGQTYQRWCGQWENDNNRWYLGTDGPGTRFYVHAQSGGTVVMGATTPASSLPSDNAWHHIALVRPSGSNIKFFVNGTEQTVGGTNIGSSSMPDVSAPLLIGQSAGQSSEWYDGFINDLRITKGVEVYTGNFTVPTGPLTKTWDSNNLGGYANLTNITSNTDSSKVKLLLTGNEGTTSTGFADSATSGTTHTITPTGSLHSQEHGGIAPAMTFPASLKKTGSAGVYFDGTTDYLTIPNSADFSFGSAAWTIDFFMYPLAINSGVSAGIISAGHEGWANGESRVWLNNDSGTYKLKIYTYGGEDRVINNIPINIWTHVAISKDSSGNFRVWFDGTAKSFDQGATTDSREWAFCSGTNGTFIGTYKSNASNHHDFKGYIDSLRVQKGVGYSTFSKPTKIYGAIKSTIIDTITLTGTAGSGGGYVTFNNATLSGNTETTSALPAGLSLNEAESTDNTATITGDLTASSGNHAINLVARVTSDGTNANIDPNRKQAYSHTITKNSGGAPVLFNARRFMGNGVAGRDINGFGFAPDMVWVKNRDTANWHVISDTLQGTQLNVFPSENNAQASASGGIQSFNPDGYTIKDDVGHNDADKGIIAWAWKAGGTPSAGKRRTDNGTSETTLDSNHYSNITNMKQSVNSTGGFSITQYTGGSTNSWFKHGLGNTRPDMFIIKSLGSTDNWIVWHTNLGSWANRWLYLDTNDDEETGNVMWQNQAPSVDGKIYIGNTSQVNTNNSYICYAWKAVAGVSAFGSYTGNGSGGGVRQYTTSDGTSTGSGGFRPKWIMTKSSDSTSAFAAWTIIDGFRSDFGTSGTKTLAASETLPLYANNNKIEGQRSNNTDASVVQAHIYDDGFQLYGDNSEVNASDTYIWMAFA